MSEPNEDSLRAWQPPPDHRALLRRLAGSQQTRLEADLHEMAMEQQQHELDAVTYQNHPINQVGHPAWLRRQAAMHATHDLPPAWLPPEDHARWSAMQRQLPRWQPTASPGNYRQTGGVYAGDDDDEEMVSNHDDDDEDADEGNNEVDHEIERVEQLPSNLYATANRMTARGMNPVTVWNWRINNQYPYVLDLSEDFGDWLDWPSIEEPPYDRLDDAYWTLEMDPSSHHANHGQMNVVWCALCSLRELQEGDQSPDENTEGPLQMGDPGIDDIIDALSMLKMAEDALVNNDPAFANRPRDVAELRRRLAQIIVRHFEEMIDRADYFRFTETELRPTGIDNGDTRCSMCLTDWDVGDEAVTMPVCKHTSCPACLTLWLAEHDSCPICRRRVERQGQ